MKVDINKVSQKALFTSLKPVTSCLLMESNPNLMLLMKLTLGDLLYRQILLVSKEEKKLHSRDKYYRSYTIVKAGINYSKFKPSRFESYFVNKVDKDSYFILVSFLRAVYTDIHSRYDFSIKIIKEENISSFFNLNYFYYLLSNVKRNVRGKTLGEKLKYRLNQIDATIKEDLLNNNQKANEILNEIGSHIFLLENINYSLFKEILNLELQRSAKKKIFI